MRWMQIREGTYRAKKVTNELMQTRDFRASRYVWHVNQPEKTGSKEQIAAQYAIECKGETSEKPIAQAQFSPEAYETDSTYTNMVRVQCNKKLHLSLANGTSRSG